MLGLGLGQIANVLAKFDSRNLSVDPNQCARLRHMKATCTRCMDNCPRHAISFGESLKVDVDRCDDCGICASVCLTGALEATKPNNAELISRIQASPQNEVLAFACPKAFKGPDERVIKVNCIGRVDTSVLVSAVAQDTRQVVLVDGPCQECPSASGRKVAAHAVEESHALAGAFGIAPHITFADAVPFETPAPGKTAASGSASASSEAVSRRAFFTSFFRDTQAAAATTVSTVLEKEPEQKPARVKGDLPQRLSAKRRLLLDALHRLGQPDRSDFEMDHGAWATCRIKPSCTACQMCAYFCPTGALTKTLQDGKPALAFRAAHCTNCRICAEVCYWKSLDLVPRADLDKVLQDTPDIFALDPEAVALLSPEEKSKRIIKSLFGI